ncbi:GmrSD restriction endonuclease domain-containing protein [Helicobacter sp. T3_23-1059]
MKKDKEALEFVMNDKWNEFNGKSKIIDNYQFFLREVERLTKEGILPEQICAAFNYLNVVAIELESDKGDDDPQAVFESINATGLHLEGVDLIRNFLMMNQNSSNQEKAV